MQNKQHVIRALIARKGPLSVQTLLRSFEIFKLSDRRLLSGIDKELSTRTMGTTS